jgi:hypothetical protein
LLFVELSGEAQQAAESSSVETLLELLLLRGHGPPE